MSRGECCICLIFKWISTREWTVLALIMSEKETEWVWIKTSLHCQSTSGYMSVNNNINNGMLALHASPTSPISMDTIITRPVIQPQGWILISLSKAKFKVSNIFPTTVAVWSDKVISGLGLRILVVPSCSISKNRQVFLDSQDEPQTIMLLPRCPII